MTVKSKIMYKIITRTLFFCFVASLTLDAEILDPLSKDSQMPGKAYNQVVGLGARPVVVENADKVLVDKIEAIKSAPPAVQANTADYVDGYLLSKIRERKDVGRVAGAGQNDINLLALPKTAIIPQGNTTNASTTASAKSDEVKEVMLVRCEVDRDYKINVSTKVDMFCRNLKTDGNSYRLSANLKVDKTTLKAVPYMMEDVHNVIYKIDTTVSRLFNGLSGSENLATFVDVRQIEKINKAVSSSFATQAPVLAKEYLTQKQKADTVLTQSSNGLTTTQLQSTTNPKPEASDYGLTLLISMLGDGVKAGVDSLYVDLGYIYFIPKGSVVDGEITVIK